MRLIKLNRETEGNNTQYSSLSIIRLNTIENDCIKLKLCLKLKSIIVSVTGDFIIIIITCKLLTNFVFLKIVELLFINTCYKLYIWLLPTKIRPETLPILYICIYLKIYYKTIWINLKIGVRLLKFQWLLMQLIDSVLIIILTHYRFVKYS